MQVKLAFTLKLTVTLLHHSSLQSAVGQYCCCNTPVLQYCQVIKDCSSLLLLVSCPSISCSLPHSCSSSSLPHCCSLNSAHYLYHIVNPVVQSHYLLSSFLAALISCQIVCCTKISVASFTKILHQNLYTSQCLYFYSPMRSSLAG